MYVFIAITVLINVLLIIQGGHHRQFPNRLFVSTSVYETLLHFRLEVIVEMREEIK